MLELIVEDLDGKRVARVTRIAQAGYSISTEHRSLHRTIDKVLAEASDTGIPLRFDKRQKMERGVKFQRFARWVKPGDQDFLQALADDLSKYELFAYTVETSAS